MSTYRKSYKSANLTKYNNEFITHARETVEIQSHSVVEKSLNEWTVITYIYIVVAVSVAVWWCGIGRRELAIRRSQIQSHNRLRSAELRTWWWRWTSDAGRYQRLATLPILVRRCNRRCWMMLRNPVFGHLKADAISISQVLRHCDVSRTHSLRNIRHRTWVCMMINQNIRRYLLH